MNVKRNLIIALAVASLGIVGSAQARGGDDGDGHRRDGHRVEQRSQARGGHHSDRFERRFDRRQERQQERIAEGRRSGDLTRGESRRLRGEQHRIEHMAHRFGADGHYSKRERHRLAEAQRRADRHIYRARHNDRSRGDHHDGWRHDHRSTFWSHRDY